MGITLKEIAAMAGVHKSTVDKVIHNRPGVSDAKRAEIQKLLKEHNYESNPLAKALNYQKKKMVVAVVMPKVDACCFIREGMNLVLQDFSSFNISVSFYETETHEDEKQAEIIRKLISENISGIVLLPIDSDTVRDAVKEAVKANIPVITTNTDLDDSGRLCYVGQDMEKGGRVAAKMLSLKMPQGGRLSVISGKMNQATKKRERAFLQYLDTCNGLFTREAMLEIQETEETAFSSSKEFFRKNQKIDALYITCGNVKEICLALQEECAVGNIRKIPEIICHERYPEIIELIKSEYIFATINGELLSQGRLAMRVLFEYLIYDQKPKQDKIFVGNEVLLKENV